MPKKMNVFILCGEKLPVNSPTMKKKDWVIQYKKNVDQKKSYVLVLLVGNGVAHNYYKKRVLCYGRWVFFVKKKYFYN
jgi:hypothetical protein